MPSKSNIIEELYKSKDFNDCINKMEPDYLRDDLKAEVILVICEMDNERLQVLYNSGALAFFVVRVIMNMIKSNSSTFYRKYRKEHEELKESYSYFDIREETPMEKEYVFDVEDLAQRQEREDLELIVLEKIKCLDWYECELLKLYIKHGNYRSIGIETNIPFPSIYKTIRSSINKIKCELSL